MRRTRQGNRLSILSIYTRTGQTTRGMKHKHNRDKHKQNTSTSTRTNTERKTHFFFFFFFVSPSSSFSLMYPFPASSSQHTHARNSPALPSGFLLSPCALPLVAGAQPCPLSLVHMRFFPPYCPFPLCFPSASARRNRVECSRMSTHAHTHTRTHAHKQWYTHTRRVSLDPSFSCVSHFSSALWLLSAGRGQWWSARRHTHRGKGREGSERERHR